MMTPDADSTWAVLGLVGNHLWQSTVVAVAAGLLILTVRQARAPVRYWIWLAASMKFLVPFGVLVALGSQVPWRTTTARPTPTLTVVMDAISQPFGPQTFDVASVPTPATAGLTTVLPVVLLAIWFLGTVALLLRWLITWRRIAAIVRNGTPVVDGRVCDALRRLEQASGVMTPIRLVSSTTTLEPGVFGIVRPVLLWSRDLGERLDDDQIEAILAHEVAHVTRRDNLTAALHMVVEALFWFHPLVWWLSARLVAERERACDEAVLQLGSDPHVYAAGILKMCEFYVESPLTCVAGVTGSDLKRRIEAIMGQPLGTNLTASRRALLAMVAATIIAAPVAVGLMNTPRVQAQSVPTQVDRPSFDVASVKPHPPGDDHFGNVGTGGRYRATNLTVHELIRTAYGLQDDQILGGPKWIDSDRFDIEATGPTGQSSLMLRRLLADRFRLSVHTESRERPIYALVTATRNGKFGPRLHSAAIDCGSSGRSGLRPALPGFNGAPGCGIRVGPGRVIGGGVPISNLVSILSPWARRVVVDRTQLTGRYDFNLEWMPELEVTDSSGARPPSDGVSIFTAIREQLGLKLESTKGLVDVLVIDHVELPTDNQADPVSQSPVTAAAPQPPAQAAPSLPAFEVASVKPNKDGGIGVLVFPPAGELIRLVNHPLSALMANAYNVTEDRIVGPDWIHTSRFDVMAKAPDASSMAPGAIRPMMRALLEERFKLAVHVESRPVPKYALVMARSDGRLGPRLQRSETDCGSDPADRRASPCGVVRTGARSSPILCR